MLTGGNGTCWADDAMTAVLEFERNNEWRLRCALKAPNFVTAGLSVLLVESDLLTPHDPSPDLTW